VALTLADTTTVIDQVGLSIGSFYKEGTPKTSLTATVDQSYERYIGGVNGNCQDDGNNVADFALANPSNPQNSTSAFVFCGVPTLTPTSTFTPTDTPTPTSTFTPTDTPIFSLTPSLTAAPGEVIISEVAWSGTLASPNDEWIELYNTRSTPISLNNWRLDTDSGSVHIILSGIIPAKGYFLLERDYEQIVSDVASSQIYTGNLADTNEVLRLKRPDSTLIDTANSDGGTWPAGSASPNFYSMERIFTVTGTPSTDTSSGWTSNNQPTTWVAHDASGNLIHGTPGRPNFSLVATITPTFTPTITSTPTKTSTPSGLRSILINEIAWAGTASGLADDEWIELYNPGSVAIDITDWVLKSTVDNVPSIVLVGVIPAGGYFLLERDDDNTVSDITADQIYTGALSNNGEILYLNDASGNKVDTANGNGGTWPKGSSTTYGTMERITGAADSDTAWVTNTGIKKNGKNAVGGAILGTPKNSNSPGPTPTPTRAGSVVATSTPQVVVKPPDPRPIINEILPRPGFDWNADGRVDVFDEFIEIKNLTSIEISLGGWILDDESGKGSDPYSLPDVTLAPGERVVFFGSETNILLSDGGDTVRLISSSGKTYDAYTYAVARAEDESICRIPDGNVNNGWYEDCIPTPNLTNTREGQVPVAPGGNGESLFCDLPDTTPADFFFAECHGYGARIWSPYYWDQLGRPDKLFIPSGRNKWKSFVE